MVVSVPKSSPGLGTGDSKVKGTRGTPFPSSWSRQLSRRGADEQTDNDNPRDKQNTNAVINGTQMLFINTR